MNLRVVAKIARVQIATKVALKHDPVWRDVKTIVIITITSKAEKWWK